MLFHLKETKEIRLSITFSRLKKQAQKPSDPEVTVRLVDKPGNVWELRKLSYHSAGPKDKECQLIRARTTPPGETKEVELIIYAPGSKPGKPRNKGIYIGRRLANQSIPELMARAAHIQQ